MLFPFDIPNTPERKKALWSFSIMDTLTARTFPPPAAPTTEDIYIRRWRSSELPVQVDQAQGLAQVVE